MFTIANLDLCFSLKPKILVRVICVFQVYLPCVLQTKKRYVGYMYETLDQKEPVFDAKGIETVRRDSCPAVAKVCSSQDNQKYLYYFLCSSLKECETTVENT